VHPETGEDTPVVVEGGCVIEVQGLTKRYGPTVAVDELSFTVAAARVTGFLGPNGAGKTTTMQLMLGLQEPTSGSATFDGLPYRAIRRPLFDVGSSLDSADLHPGRSARGNLLALAQSNGIPTRRVGEVLDVVGLSDVARQRTRTFSLGMTQRLGLAAALLGDPATLVLDEPANGLDPEGIVWLRRLLRSLAAEGRTVFLSSHLMSEMALTADHLVVIGRGRLIADTSVEEFVRTSAVGCASVRTPDRERLTAVLVAAGRKVRVEPDGSLSVRGIDAAAVGAIAAQHGIELHELVNREASLEEAFMEQTRESLDYQAPAAIGEPGQR
jgi:ABC-2 type transport system ATP-binding protein